MKKAFSHAKIAVFSYGFSAYFHRPAVLTDGQFLAIFSLTCGQFDPANRFDRWSAGGLPCPLGSFFPFRRFVPFPFLGSIYIYRGSAHG